MSLISSENFEALREILLESPDITDVCAWPVGENEGEIFGIKILVQSRFRNKDGKILMAEQMISPDFLHQEYQDKNGRRNLFEILRNYALRTIHSELEKLSKSEFEADAGA